MERVKHWEKQLDSFERRKSKYSWDELEELITDEFEDGKLSAEEFDVLMQRLMDMDEGLME